MKIKAKDEQVKTLDNVHLVVSVKVAPIEGKVNDAVIRIIAKNFGIPRNLIRLRNGSASHVLRKCSDFEVKTLKSVSRAIEIT